MTPSPRHSPEPLIVYPHPHRNSQCCSCSTVMPGDICFNCGRLSTLLITPRPPRDSMGRCAPATETSGPTQNQSRSPDSQLNQVRGSLFARRRPTQPFAKQCAFDSQFTEVEDLLDARNKLARIHTLVASDAVLLNDRGSKASSQGLSCSSGLIHNSSTAHSTQSSRYSPRISSTAHSTQSSRYSPRISPPDSFIVSDGFSEDGTPHAHDVGRWLADLKPAGRSAGPLPYTAPSDSTAVSDIVSEDGGPHGRVVARWLEDRRPTGWCSAELTKRGVDCCININGKICEWVVFL